MAKLYYQGHGSFRLRTDGGTVVYVDPYAGNGYDLPASLILVSHEHYDHTATDKCAKKDGCMIFRAADLLENGEYRSVSAANVKVTAVPAYNKNHPKDACVGFIIETDGLKIYAAGDTSKTDYMSEMAGMALDWAILPGDGIYNMNVHEASECAKLIGAKHSVPIHLKPGALFDRKTAEQFSCEGRVIVEPGEEIIL